MNHAGPLIIVGPLLVAAVLVMIGRHCPRWLASGLAIATALCSAVTCAALAWQAGQATIVSWLGDWTPARGTARGIALVADPASASMAALCATVVAAALIFSARYFQRVEVFFESLVLILLASMTGACLTGDLFNLFVFLELMSVSSFALCAYRFRDPNALEGSISIAVTNSVGAFLVLIGIALVYARTGALNEAQIGQVLASRPPDALVVISLALILSGLFVKAAIVPFHFWLPEAHAVAPGPVSMIFSGVMVEVGLVAALRIYFACFHLALHDQAPILRTVLLAVGALTAVVGSLYCIAQRHIKRMLASSTVAHMGLILMGAAMMVPESVAGAGVYLLSHGMLKAALFAGAGILIHRTGKADTTELHGKGKGLWPDFIVFTTAGLGIAGLPPFGTALGKAAMEHAAATLHIPWIPWIFAFCGAVTGGAILRAAAFVFLGWGADQQVQDGAPTEQDEQETIGHHDRTSIFMIAPAAVLLLGALAVGMVPLARPAAAAAARFVDSSRYQAEVLTASLQLPLEQPPAPHWSTAALLWGGIAAVGALVLARASLKLRRNASESAFLSLGARAMERVHSGHVGDQVLWIAAGAVAIALTLALWIA